MTIKYLDSKRLSGVASDTKPTNVQDNSIYIETDTAYRYWFNGTVWFPTFQDNFHSDGWTPVGGFTGVSGGVLTGDLIRNNTNHGAGRAITALDNSAWVMRFKLVINTKATSENNSVVMGISQTGVTGINDPRYGLGVGLSQYHNKFRLVYPANQTWYQAVVSTAGSDPVPDAGTYYIELKRTSTTSVTLNIFSDSSYSTNNTDITPAPVTLNVLVPVCKYVNHLSVPLEVALRVELSAFAAVAVSGESKLYANRSVLVPLILLPARYVTIIILPLYHNYDLLSFL